MILNIIKRQHYIYIILISLFALASCSSDESQSKNVAIPDENYSEYVGEAAAPDETYPEYAGEAAAPDESYFEYAEEAAAPDESYPESTENTNRIDEYNVVLGADEKIQIPGIPGELRVWIGSTSNKPDFPDRMVKDEASIPAVGESATVQPFAPAFEIDPVETQCLKIHPSGSEVRFKLIPLEQGLFEVGANVYLYDSPDCSGAPIPKTVSSLKVIVEIDKKVIFSKKMNELWSILWEKFVEFWAALIAIIFGVILFIIKGKLKKWFGYEND